MIEFLRRHRGVLGFLLLAVVFWLYAQLVVNTPYVVTAQ